VIHRRDVDPLLDPLVVRLERAGRDVEPGLGAITVEPPTARPSWNMIGGLPSAIVAPPSR
jgi:hypothetical protein